MYKIGFYVPAAEADRVKEALFQAGAGRIGLYDKCCWSCKGLGQFRPLAGSNPALGQVGELESVEELRVEMVVADKLVRTAVKALLSAHPYEEPAYDVVRILGREELTDLDS